MSAPVLSGELGYAPQLCEPPSVDRERLGQVGRIRTVLIDDLVVQPGRLVFDPKGEIAR